MSVYLSRGVLVKFSTAAHPVILPVSEDSQVGLLSCVTGAQRLAVHGRLAGAQLAGPALGKSLPLTITGERGDERELPAQFLGAFDCAAKLGSDCLPHLCGRLPLRHDCIEQ